MKIAAVINKEENIVPIVEGGVLRIYDTETFQHQDFPNPAVELKEGRRGGALKFAEQKGVEAFAAPPQTFCELSYERAKEDHIKFFPLPSVTLFSQFKERVDDREIDVKEILHSSEIAPSFPTVKNEE